MSAAFVSYAGCGKTAFDLGLLFLAGPVALILIPLLAVLVALDGGRPFYSQPRVGRDGRIFRLWKLRTMVPDADACLALLLARDPAARAEWSHRQKLRHDPRITRIGRFLRRTSLDEMPQLWNVWRGDMSLVGPRPMLPNQRALYPGTDYYALRPGLTGLWQISQRNGCSFRERAAYDAQYRRTLSFTVDLRVILSTVRVVLRGTGQ